MLVSGGRGTLVTFFTVQCDVYLGILGYDVGCDVSIVILSRPLQTRCGKPAPCFGWLVFGGAGEIKKSVPMSYQIDSEMARVEVFWNKVWTVCQTLHSTSYFAATVVCFKTEFCRWSHYIVLRWWFCDAVHTSRMVWSTINSSTFTLMTRRQLIPWKRQWHFHVEDHWKQDPKISQIFNLGNIFNLLKHEFVGGIN